MDIREKIQNDNIDCLVFDFDGTLFDTRIANIEAYKSAFMLNGLFFDEQRYREAFGLRFDEMMDIVCPSSTKEERKAIKESKAVFYENNVSLVVPNDRLIRLIVDIRRIRPKIHIGLATTASKKNVFMLLEKFKLTSYFDGLLFGEDIVRTKPDPECYIRCMEMFSVLPEHTLIFEDSEVGILAARRSGAKVIRVDIATA